MTQPRHTPFGTGVQRFSEPRGRIFRLDFLLLFATLGLIAFSLVTLDAATADAGTSSHYFATRQGIYAIIGLVLMIALASIDYSRFRELKTGLYVAMMGLIVTVLALGGATRGSRRWIELPFFRFQPSELGKVLLVLALSAFVLDRLRYINDRQTTSRIMLLALVPTLLVMAQPDLGTSIIYINIALALLFVAGTKWTHFAALAGLAAAAAVVVLVIAPAVGTPLLKGYQEDRLTAFLHKNDADPRSQGYQLNQAQTAIGSGRKTGRGAERVIPDEARLPPGEPHRLRVRRGRRTFRVRGRSDRAVALCAADLALVTNPDDREEPLRRVARRRGRRDADDPGVRERRR